MLAWPIRYLLFAFGDPDPWFSVRIYKYAIELLAWVLGILLHGICYDFFFVTGQIYNEQKAGVKNKSAAQGLITLATYGVGMMIGFWLAGKIFNMYTLEDGSHDWKMIWIIPSTIAVVIMLWFGFRFKNEKITTA
jgi:MFS family permease